MTPECCVLLEKDGGVSDTTRGFRRKVNSAKPPNSVNSLELSGFMALLNLESAIALPLILIGTTKRTNKQTKRGIPALILLFPASLNDIVSKSDLILWHC